MTYLVMSLVVLIISAVLSDGFASKLLTVGLAIVCLIFSRDIFLGSSNITNEMTEYVFLSSMFVFLTALTFYFINFPMKVRRPAHLIYSYKYINVPFWWWTMLAVGLYFCLLVVSDTIGKGWDEAANAIGEYPWFRIIFLIAYYSSVLRLRIMAIHRKLGLNFFIELAFITIITVLMREKIYGLFLILAMTVGVVRPRFLNFVLVSVGGIFSYFGIAYYRWLGAINYINSDKLVNTFYSIIKEPIESGLGNDFSKIFSYYAKNEILFGDSYLKFISLPLKVLFGYSAYENPIYKYHEIASDENLISVMIGSAHPSLFGDSFANFGFIGVLIPSIWYAFFSISEKVFRRGDIRYEIFLMGTLLLLPLVVRGSIYNGLLSFFLILSIGMLNVSCICKSFRYDSIRYKV